MDVPDLTLRRLARVAATLAAFAGIHHVLYLLGAFGPVSCWEAQSASGTASANGSATTTTPTVTRGCESGIDFLLGSFGPAGGGNAGVLFSWALVLSVLVALGVYGTWTERRYLVGTTVVAGAATTVVGVFSIGWFFLLPTLFLFVAATALTVEARRERD
ncbi:hypothetical protein ACFQJD_06045 [Haloplanus sp. GCM10025708]|uniref:hypothetical protein n=1 Tax=Haloferacaceae TaxID=1644056 RepID=UPI003620A14A